MYVLYNDVRELVITEMYYMCTKQYLTSSQVNRTPTDENKLQISTQQQGRDREERHS